MNVVRFASPARITSLRTMPAVVRYYTDGRQEGATATSEGFAKREQAQEGQYVKKREAEKLKAAQEKLKHAQDEVDKQQKKVDDLK